MSNFQLFLLGFAVASVLWGLLIGIIAYLVYRDSQNKLGDTSPRAMINLNPFDWFDFIRAIVGMIWYGVWKSMQTRKEQIEKKLFNVRPHTKL